MTYESSNLHNSLMKPNVSMRETLEDSKGVIRGKWETDREYNEQNDKQ